MAIPDFFPFEDGQVVTAAQWNELFAAVADGSFFNNSTAIGEQIQSLVNRVVALENRTDALNSIFKRRLMRQQLVLVPGQSIVTLERVPLMDSEMVSVNGQVWSRTGTPAGFVGDYSLSERTITINPEQVANIQGDDNVLVVTYQYEVE